ncbi:sensor histidine kinase [Flavicella sediminum]|uniref:sensor histidine kinase n=1 Tax=Flavicella sediminum TaxID=2585141 RepID=UPI001123E22A|nr:ATP-binding protein [Flavicella sediminum]
MIKKIAILLLFLTSICTAHKKSIAIVNSTMAIDFVQNPDINYLANAKLLFNQNKLEQALESFLKISNTSENSEIKGECFYYISQILLKSKRLKKALEYTDKTINIASKTADTTKIIDNYIVAAKIHFKIYSQDSISFSKHLDSLSYYAHKGLYLIKQYPYLKAESSLYHSLSIYHYYHRNKTRSENYVLKSLDIEKLRKDTIAQILILNTLAGNKLGENNYAAANKFYQQAYTLLSKAKDYPKKTKHKQMLYTNLAWTKYNLKDYKAYDYLAKANSINDSLRDLEFDGIISEVEAKHNVDIIKQNSEKRRIKEVQFREKMQLWGGLLILGTLGLAISFWIYRKNSKLNEENIQLQFNQSKLLKEKELEKLKSDTQIKILNATLDGKESERKQIAETLHDSVSALLSAANLHLQASKSQYKGEVPIEINKTQDIIDEASSKIRNLSHELISSVLLKFGLSFAIQDFCEKYSNSQIEIISNIKNIGRYDQNFEIKINNIIEEFINNILKHSKASQASVSILAFQKSLFISIKDDGIGFNPKKKQKSDGIGINQIEARIKMMQGEFLLDSKVNEGTKIEITVPIIYKT